jgi:2-polyprenyl-3-methyl-5-hydroxy-6-metoxy-1,4-benzoquinol methylase
VPRAIVRAARRERLKVRITACDVHAQTVALARERCRTYPEIDVARADAVALPFADGAFDIALLSLTLHHFADAVQLAALRELARVCRRALVVNELERSWPNYLGARLLATTLWRTNPLTRHDGPVSVLRAFTPAELYDRAHVAGLTGVHVRRAFFYRLVLVAGGDAGSAAAAHTVA